MVSILPTYDRAPLTFVKGAGCWMIEADGRRFLDLGAGIAVNVLGHAHPALVAALNQQAQSLWHVSNLYHIPQQRALADKLVDASFADTVFFTNSGTEACELAIKMTRKYWFTKQQPARTTLVAFEGAFHGRSSGGIAASGSAKLTHGFGPLLPGFAHVPWGDLDALEGVLKTHAATLAAVIVEPIQGEGGIRPLSDAQLRQLRALCDRHGVLLILDEVQCGVGRTGRLFAHEWAGIKPDIMMAAKGLGGGFPLGAVLATTEAASGMGVGSHGSTYGGNPLACAVGCAVLDIVNDPEFLAEVCRKAGAMRQHLEGLVATHPQVFDHVRGAGLMLGLKCKVPNVDVVQAGYAAQVAVVPAADNVVRLLPPLIISDEDIAEAMARLESAAQRIERDIAGSAATQET